MWTTDREHYVLLRVGVGADAASFLPYDLRTGTAVVIEDPDTEREAIQSMLAAGVPVTDQVPEAAP